ncbi:hypothetical protein Aph01nite_39260 [Acrocarpospora phusangensis]|uniref:ABC3 transporter permease protein domain-containing protein n=1 Tax=Acrocarpospora phusangensis TaxID=1070424 RepID=A0A919QB76_9ACTN|nr:FtsX-like permease family protein [Acrocarpospora phusangensis]GIH25616.1 hypothetical protein Aph01nite_39260 [Acrocarpospora phusangensis]
MTALWLRLEIRRRLPALVALTLLVALSTGVVLAAVAGALRGMSALDRLRAVTLPATIGLLPNEPGFDWDRVRRLPGVAAAGTFASSPFVTEGRSASAVAFLPPADGEMGRTVERPVVLAGRAADPRRADEVTVTPRYLEAHGKAIGDTITVTLLTPEQMDAPEVPGRVPAGPRIELRIVGVARSFLNSDPPETGPGSVLPTHALFERHRANFTGAASPGNLNGVVRLTGGEEALPAFVAALDRPDVEIWNVAEAVRKDQAMIAFEGVAALAFALTALVAAALLTGQAVARLAAAGEPELRVLRALGLTRRELLAVGAAGPALAGAAGAALGVALAVLLSAWTPIGSAARMEPAPGIAADWLVLGPGWAAATLAVPVRAGLAVWAAVRAGSVRPVARRSALAELAGRLPVPVAVGTRFALEPGRGRRPVPVRPALLGAVAGVLGVLAAFTFADAVDDASAEPAAFGQTHGLSAHFGYNDDGAPAAPLIATMLRDPDVAGVNDTRIGVATRAGASFSVLTYAPAGAWPPAVLTAGAAANRAGDIVLAPSTAGDLGAAVGDEVALAGSGRTASFLVTGIGLLPESPHSGYSHGAWVTPDGYDRLFAPGEFKFRLGLAALRPGADPEAAAARLRAAGLQIELTAEVQQAAQLRGIRPLPLLLAAFLIVLAVAAVAHALTSAVLRRRRELAVLRALGMTRAQARGVVLTQGVVLAGAGLVFGVPLGIALGRTLWRVMADLVPVLYRPPLAEAALALVAPAALLVACAAALWPARRAARLPVGMILRAE